MSGRLSLPWACVLATVVAGVAGAQEIEPRTYMPAPVGTIFVLATYGHSDGAIVLDPAVEVEHVEADLRIVTLAAGRTFSLAGRQARALIVAPIAWGEVTGEVGAEPRRQDLSGTADPRVKLTVGLHGAAARSAGAFASAERETFVGASLGVIAPWGSYDSGRLVNLGSHRWAFKPELGASVARGRWTFEGALGAWLFTANREFFPGAARRAQQPLASIQGHVTRALPNGAWVGLHGTLFGGGRTRVDGTPSPDLQRNLRLGGTVSVPIRARQSIKIAYSTGALTRRGNDFDTLSATWQLVVI